MNTSLPSFSLMHMLALSKFEIVTATLCSAKAITIGYFDCWQQHEINQSNNARLYNQIPPPSPPHQSHP